MTYRKFLNRIQNAKEAENEEIFIGEEGYPADEPLNAEDYIKAMHLIYAASNGNFKELLSGRKIAPIARAYGIPYKSMQKWVSGERTPPEYLIRLVAFAIINDLERGNAEKTRKVKIMKKYNVSIEERNINAPATDIKDSDWSADYFDAENAAEAVENAIQAYCEMSTDNGIDTAEWEIDGNVLKIDRENYIVFSAEEVE